MFYSISSPQKGLSGIDVAKHLIKSVVSLVVEKHGDNEKLIFCTLSPLPGFRKWLEGEIDAGNIQDSFNVKSIHYPQDITKKEDDAQFKKYLLENCIRYLMDAKRNGKEKRECLDPVANFHLKNGASLYRLNWFADISKKGIDQSFGLMVNYYYDLRELDRNRDNYISRGFINANKDNIGV